MDTTGTRETGQEGCCSACRGKGWRYTQVSAAYGAQAIDGRRARRTRSDCFDCAGTGRQGT
ncbi:hypothetical protein GCM10014719_38730 [Planomonospora parontospora subsp. antibiotica]|nr:hypothetical protein GCM10014719_38730 [Planomonospora parontospora subsp. antibiotica]GII17134.1 hypothetical protein Ppa05_38600 [Planomonospora parontospora subsp. antibiotica]